MRKGRQRLEPRNASMVVQWQRIYLQCRRLGSTPGSGRSLGEGNGNPLQYSCLENSMDRGAWWAIVLGWQRVRHDLATKPPLAAS